MAQWALESLQMVNAAAKLKCLLLGRKDKSRQCIKKQRYYFAKKGPYSQSIIFPVVMYWMWKLDIKEADCQRIDAFELWC